MLQDGGEIGIDAAMHIGSGQCYLAQRWGAKSMLPLRQRSRGIHVARGGASPVVAELAGGTERIDLSPADSGIAAGGVVSG